MKNINKITTQPLNVHLALFLCGGMVVLALGFFHLPAWSIGMAWLDPSIWQLLLLSLLAFMCATTLAWWLQHWAWPRLGLPAMHQIFSQFQSLTLWQQYVFFLASFALLLLAAVGAMVAIC